ncbi:acyltransferase-domain-containing protein [Obelidium mucronatum]|nr:acyltransferase-domain-containing protein [Obelidium mucronatum]
MDIVKSLFFGSATIPGSAPGSAGASGEAPARKEAEKAKKTPLFFARLFVFALLWVLVPLAAVLVGAVALPLLAAGHAAFRAAVRHVEKAVGALVVFTAYLFTPGAALVVSGDLPRMHADRKMVVMANHQIYPDWLYLWCVAWHRNLHGDFRVMMIKVLSMIPILGQAMSLFEFIYLNQKLDKDRPILRKNLSLARKDKNLPLWMLIFPEGTLNTPGNIEKSRKYAEKMGTLDSHPNHCILPKSTGLFYTIQDLQPVATDVFDLTIGYSGVKPNEIPFEVLLPDKVFLNGQYPLEIHVHCTHFSVPEIPGFTPDSINSLEEDRKKPFDEWLRNVWTAKDARLSRFYNTGSLLSKEEVDSKTFVTTHVPLIPRSSDFFYLFGLLFAGYSILPLYWTVIYYSLYLIFSAVYYLGWTLIQVVGFSRLILWTALILFLDGLVRKRRLDQDVFG